MLNADEFRRVAILRAQLGDPTLPDSRDVHIPLRCDLPDRKGKSEPVVVHPPVYDPTKRCYKPK